MMLELRLSYGHVSTLRDASKSGSWLAEENEHHLIRYNSIVAKRL